MTITPLPVERWTLRLLWGFTLVAIAGFATFGLHPELLARVPTVAWMYGPAFELFASGQVWIAFGALAVILSLRTGTRWLTAFGATYLISLTSELAGTTFGFPFGAYQYTGLMEPQWLGRVPIVIPLSWFYMAVASYGLASELGRGLPGSFRGKRVAVAALVLTLWDLSLDPAMSAATRYWTWDEAGAYYGMPWINLAGWYVTGLLLMAALAAMRVERWLDRVPRAGLASFYTANLVLPIGMNAAAGLWGAAVAGVAVLAVGWALLARSPATAGPPPRGIRSGAPAEAAS